MYSLKEERISQLTPFSVLADNKRLRNKIIEGKSFQKTRSGKNLYSSVLNSSSNVTANNLDLIIDFSKDIDTYARLTFNKEVGKTYTFVFDGSGMADGESVTFYLEQSTQLFNFKNGKNVWVQNAINENSYFTLDNRSRSNISSTITISNIMILEGEYTEETIPEYEAYGASPSPEFPSEIQSVGDDVNLFNKEGLLLHKPSYIDVEILNTGIKLTQTVDGQYRYIAYDLDINKILGKTITIKSDIIKSGENTPAILLYWHNNGTLTNRTNLNDLTLKSSGTAKVTIPSEVPEGSTGIAILFYSNQNGTGAIGDYVEYTNVKLQVGDTSTAYSEYGKGTVEIKQSGKNFSEITSISGGYTQTLKEGTVTINGNNTSASNVVMYLNNKNLKLKGNREYTISVICEGKIENTGYKVCYLRTNNSSINIGSIGTNKKIIYKYTPNEDANISFISFDLAANTTFTNYVVKIQIEEGTEATEYQEHKGNNYIIPLSQPLRSLPNGVKDTIEEDGIHRRVGSVILDGSENWSTQQDNYHTENRMMFAAKIDILGKGVSKRKGLCNYFKHYDNTVQSSVVDITAFNFNDLTNYSDYIYFKIDRNLLETEDLSGWKKWLSEHTPEVIYNLAEEVIEPFNEEQQAVMNEMETFEGLNHFNLVGDLETTLTFDYNPQITEEIKKAFKYNITKAYLEVAATDKASGFQINEDNYLQSIDFDDCRYIEGEGVIGSCVAKELQGKFVNVDSSFDIENREVECFIGAETEDNITHYLRLGTFIVQKPENDNVKDNTSFDSLDYMIKFNKEYVHRMAKYLKTEDTDIYPEKQYYILNESGVYEEVIVPHKEEISNYYELIDEYTLMQLLKDICEQCEVKLGTFNFRNADYLVHGNRFDSGVSCRDVLKAIAQAAFSWARINEYNELLLDFETSDTISEEIDYNEYYGLNFNDNYGPVNTIVLKNSQAEGENITIKNDDLINSPIGKNLFTNLKWQEQTYAYFKIADGTHILSLKLKEGKTIPSDLYLGFSQNGYYLSTQLIKWIIQNGSYGTSLVDNEFRYIDNISKDGHILQYLSVFPVKYKDTLTEYFDIQLEKNSKFSGYEEPIPLGTKELAISDNPFAYSEETRKAIIQAGEAIYGFKYVPLSVETIGAAYLNCKDKLKIKNMQDGDLETYVFDTRISYQGTLKSNVETLAMTDTETKYRYDGSLTTAQRRTEFRVDKAEQKITSLVKATTEQGEKLTEAVQDLDGFKRTITDKTDETAEKVTTIEEKVDGLITSKSISGGQNLIKNSVGYFGNDYWQINAETEGTVLSENSTDVKQNSISGSALKLQAETIYQDIKEIKNGEYYLSFNYKRIINTAIATLKVNDLTINLTEENWKEEAHLINVTTNNIKIEMTTDLNSSILITDLMLTEGNMQVSWTQNANESYTDNVQIGKGVRITATGSDTEFLAEASGITINNTETGGKVAEFTKYGTETQELVAHKDVKVADSLLIQKIGNQTWFSSL